MGTPTISVAQQGSGVLVSITNLSIAASGATSFELYRSLPERYWRGPYSTRIGDAFGRIATAPVTQQTFFDGSAESGTDYSYFIRSVGATVPATADSAVSVVNDFELAPGLYVSSADNSVVAASGDSDMVRFPIYAPGMTLPFTSESADLLLAGRTYPVVEFGIHDLTAFEVTVLVDTGEASTGTEFDLIGWERQRTVVCLRDPRGVKAYGVLKNLQTQNVQWGRAVTFTLQPVDFDASTA